MQELIKIIGAESHGMGHKEKIVSAIGGFIGIALPMWVSLYYLGTIDGVLLIASMGASAVLLFAAPHSPLAQPWPLIGGNVISALIGVACAQNIADPMLAAPLSVGLAIGVMYYTRCLHPPGGGTVLVAVLGGEQVHALGYQFVFAPVLLNVVSMLLAAIAFNYAFSWRRYPAYFREVPASKPPSTAEALAHEDLKYAIEEIGAYIDISEEDLSQLYKLARKHAAERGALGK